MMPLRSSILYLLFSLMFIGGSLNGRSAGWKPDRVPGSARLALAEIDTVYLPPEPSAPLVAALEDLVACWPGELKQEESGAVSSKQSLVLVRDTGYGIRDTGGFSIRRERTRVYLSASTDEGLANGLYAICRELLGARWYWGGDLGFEQVGEMAEKFPDGLWREQPAFVQRTLYPVGSDYGRRNRLNRKYSFNHNLARIFTGEVYEESPEVFAEIGGERRRPKGSAGTDPQPDFTEPKAVELAVEAARAHFEENPKANSFSLSINDNSLFDEGERTAAAVLSLRQAQARSARGQRTEFRGQKCPNFVKESPPTTQRLNHSLAPRSAQREGEVEYFRGRPNYTDLVFGFMNQVAERLERAEGGDLKPEENGCWSQVSGLKSQPSAPYLTALAYYWTEQSPSFKIHPLVMPVLTSDRAQWHDPIYRAEDKALIDRWAKSGAERIASWDYYFGAPYPYPRQFTQWIGESIAYLHDAGVDVFFSQLPSVWGLDGPKAWLTAELLWDPEQDVEVLLDEFYTNFFGSAAEPIREFYEIAEQTRNEREGPANWIKFYKDEAGIELFDEATIQKMRACLEEAERLLAPGHTAGSASARREPQSGESVEMASGATTNLFDPDRFAKRVEVVSDAFSYTESYANYHRGRVALVERAVPALNADARQDGQQSALLRALADYRDAQASFNTLKRVLVAKPMHGGFSTFSRLKQSDPEPLALTALLGLGFDPKNLAWGGETDVTTIRAWQACDAAVRASGRNPSLKHSGMERRNFLGPDLPVVEAWEMQYRASDGLRIVAASGREDSGIRIENADIVSLSQTYPVFGEKLYVLEIDASWQVSPDNRTWVQLNWESIGGENLQLDFPLRLPNGSSAGKQTLRWVLNSPANAYDLKVGVVTNRQYAGDFIEIERIEFGQLLPKR